jgi:iron complex transport system permease protein
MITGPSSVGLGALSEWLSGEISEGSQTILLFIRLPRTLACIIAGGGLALSGMLLQTALHNPLASPGIIGVNSGAGLAVVLAAALFPPLFWIRGAAAFIGALLATLLIWLIASRTGASKTTVILSGVAVSGLLAALIDTVISIFPETISDRSAFYIGGFASVSLKHVLSAAPFTIASVIMSAVISRRLGLLPMGDEVASSLGLNVRRCRFLAILCAAMLSASAVSVAGLLGFVGLIVPHMARKLAPPNMRVLLPVSFLLGVCLTLACDIIGRMLFAPYELSAGIPLALIGAPFFLYLILSRRRHQHD